MAIQEAVTEPMSRLSDRRYSLVLGAGGMKGLAHIGVLRCLEEQEAFPEDVVGCSVGSLIAAAWCAVRVRRHDIPVRELTAEDWQAGERGFLGHEAADWRHGDPGDEFPWERFLGMVAELAEVDDRPPG